MRSEAMQTLRAGCSKADPQTHRQGDYNTLRSLARCVINSAIDDKPCDASRVQSRSPNMVPSRMLGMVSY